MYNYPLRFKFDPENPDNDLSILDSKKNEILFRPRPGKQMNDGRAPVIIFTAKDRLQPIYHYTIQKQSGKIRTLITTATDLKLGSVMRSSQREWQILDAQDLPFGEITEKCTMKKTWWEILWSTSVVEDLLKLFLPHRYEVSMRGVKALVLRESDSTLVDDYFLKKKGEFNEREEALLIAGLISILGE